MPKTPEISKWMGLYTAVSPHAVPLGGARTMTNWRAPTSTYLTTREPLVEHPVLAPTSLSTNIIGLFRYDRDAGETLILHTDDGNIYDTTTQAPYETGVTVRSCWAQGPVAGLIRVDGAARGTIRFETTGAPSVYDLGVDPPTITPTIAPTAAGNAFAGTYACGFRYTTTDGSYSELSDFATLAPTAAGTTFSWTVAYPTDAPRIIGAELYRSTVDASDVLYKVTTLASPTTTYSDTLSDDALQANVPLPMLVKSELLWARRQGVPPTTCAVVVPHRERFLYTVDSTYPRRVYYSYVGEPESVPADQNAFDVPYDALNPDRNTGCIPYGTSFLITQHRSTFRYSYATEPYFDLDGKLIVHRGMLHQRCWAMLGDALFVLDQRGLWGLTPDGFVEYEQPIQDLFKTRINWAAAERFFVSADVNNKLIRAHVSLADDTQGGAISIATTQTSRANTYVQNRIDTLSSTVSPTVAATVTTQTTGSPTILARHTITGFGPTESGEFTLTYDSQETSPIAYSADASAIESALVALSSIGSGDVSVSLSGALENGGDAYVDWTNSASPTELSMSCTIAPYSYSIRLDRGYSGPTNEVQEIYISPIPSTGTWALTFSGTTTGSLAANPSTATVKSTCNAAWGNGTIDSVTGQGVTYSPFVLTFGGAWAATNAPQITADVGTLKAYPYQYEEKTLTADSTPITLATRGSSTCWTWDSASVTEDIEDVLGTGACTVTGGPLPGNDIVIEWTGSQAGEDGPAAVELTGTSATHMTVTNSQAAEGFTGRNEIQTITLPSDPSAGTWTLANATATTSPLAYSISAANLETAIEGLTGIGNGNVSVVTSGQSYVYAVTFQGTLAATNVALLAATSHVVSANATPRWALVYAVDEGQFWMEEYADGLGASCIIYDSNSAAHVAFGGPKGLVLYHASSGATDTYDGTTAPSTAIFKTGLIPASVIADAGQDSVPAVVVNYEPTTATVELKLRLYWDHDTTAVTFNAEAAPGYEADWRLGNDYISIDLSRAASQFGSAPGSVSVPLRAFGGTPATLHRWFALEFSVESPAEPVTLYGVEFRR